ncbi:MAG: NYN domain-containing protein [Rhodospirillales bacterium]|nr:NYN domain-containing protein [Rhodospirillales bacterium]
MERVVCFVDGLNLYHAIDNLNFKMMKDMNYLKWLDLKAVCEKFIDPKTQQLDAIYNFTAYATHLADAYARHRQYIKALNTRDVTTVLGKFKNKSVWAWCCNDGAQKVLRQTHEEKESDVNMALYILNKAYQDEYDRAIIISRDSDIVPAVKMVHELFPEKKFSSISPPHAGHSSELLQYVDKGYKHKLSIERIEKCLFDHEVLDNSGEIVATRPQKYFTYHEKKMLKTA